MVVNGLDAGNGFQGLQCAAVGNVQIPVLYAVGTGGLNYALFMDNVYKQRWDFTGTPWKARMYGDQLRWYVMTGPDLPDLRADYIELTGRPTAWGQPALKVHGKMFVCIASHKSAEPNSLVVMMAFADRDALVEDDPGTYYLKKHYLNHPCVLVRLPRIRLDALRDLVVGAHRFVNVQIRNKSDTGIRRGTARRSRDRR
jgi:hypothetical protein